MQTIARPNPTLTSGANADAMHTHSSRPIIGRSTPHAFAIYPNAVINWAASNSTIAADTVNTSYNDGATFAGIKITKDPALDAHFPSMYRHYLGGNALDLSNFSLMTFDYYVHPGTGSADPLGIGAMQCWFVDGAGKNAYCVMYYGAAGGETPNPSDFRTGQLSCPILQSSFTLDAGFTWSNVTRVSLTMSMIAPYVGKNPAITIQAIRFFTAPSKPYAMLSVDAAPLGQNRAKGIYDLMMYAASKGARINLHINPWDWQTFGWTIPMLRRLAAAGHQIGDYVCGQNWTIWTSQTNQQKIDNIRACKAFRYANGLVTGPDFLSVPGSGISQWDMDNIYGVETQICSGNPGCNGAAPWHCYAQGDRIIPYQAGLYSANAGVALAKKEAARTGKGLMHFLDHMLDAERASWKTNFDTLVADGFQFITAADLYEGNV